MRRRWNGVARSGERNWICAGGIVSRPGLPLPVYAWRRSLRDAVDGGAHLALEHRVLLHLAAVRIVEPIVTEKIAKMTPISTIEITSSTRVKPPCSPGRAAGRRQRHVTVIVFVTVPRDALAR